MKPYSNTFVYAAIDDCLVGGSDSRNHSGQIDTSSASTSSYQDRMRLAAIVDSSDDAIVSKDLNGVVTSWNRAAERLFGYTSREMIGRSILTIIPPELQYEEPEILAKLRAGERIEHYETERMRKDGERISVSLTISPMRDPDGKVIGASKIARDITERKRLQDAIIQSEKLAATGRMAAAIAHEINNPLEAVTNLAFLISSDPTLSESGKNYAKMLLDEIGRVSQVAKQSLSFFRDSGKPGEFDVRDLLDSVVNLNRPLINRKDIQVLRQYRTAGPAFGSASEVRQVFANLIRNAIEALDFGGRISLRVRQTASGNLHILVADNGHGIPADTLPKLFQPFVTSKGAAGNGLGLWVSSGIIKKHRGAIHVRTCTIPGRSGTVFTITLPSGTAPVISNPTAAEKVLS